MIDCVNYVITHKPYPVEQDGLYRKLCVGGCADPDGLTEKTGENISEYNDRINELTGLYWMWKNDRHEYVGLSHYRRFFYNCGRRLDVTGIEDILVNDGYDIILSDFLRLPWTVKQNIEMIVGPDLYRSVFGEFYRAIACCQPEYASAFLYVLSGPDLYHKNMFVCRREIMERYCEWLFSFILDVTDKVDVTGLSAYEKRVCGYFGEIMPTVWLRKQDLKICEMPIMAR